jgi:hypothetical protein
MGKLALLSFLAAALLCVACEDDFSPKSGFTPQLAVFAVLDPTQSVQTVRLMWSYDSEVGPVTKPLTDTEVREAEVKILRGGETYVFRDTVLTATDGSKVRAWINHDLRPQPDKEYRLRVTVPGHPDATSTITLPSRLYVRADLIRPDTGIPTIRAIHGVNAFVTRPAGFYFRLWVEVEKWNFGDPTRERREIPLRHITATDTWLYSTPERDEETIWSAAMLKRIAEEMVLPTDSVSARRVIVNAYALDANFYSYYKIVRGFEDPRSVRLDRPDITFIDGGLGVFGGMVQDSVVYNYYLFIRE